MEKLIQVVDIWATHKMCNIVLAVCLLESCTCQLTVLENKKVSHVCVYIVYMCVYCIYIYIFLIAYIFIVDMYLLCIDWLIDKFRTL